VYEAPVNRRLFFYLNEMIYLRVYKVEAYQSPSQECMILVYMTA
jgi:hypothetical protein